MKTIVTPTFTPVPDAIRTIECAPTPTPRGALRGQDLKVRSATIRKLLRDLGIVGVSVTTPQHSMACATRLKVPKIAHTFTNDHERRTCPACRRHYLAGLRLEALVLAAYPDMKDRGDTQSDHFDYALTVA